MKQQLQGGFTVFVLLLAAYGAYVVMNDPPLDLLQRSTADRSGTPAPPFDLDQPLAIGDAPSLSIDTSFPKNPADLGPGGSFDYDLSSVPGFRQPPTQRDVPTSPLDTSPQTAMGAGPYGAVASPSASAATAGLDADRPWRAPSQDTTEPASDPFANALANLAGGGSTSSLANPVAGALGGALPGGSLVATAPPRATENVPGGAWPENPAMQATNPTGRDALLPRLPDDMFRNAPRETWPKIDAPPSDPLLTRHADHVRAAFRAFLDTVCQRLNAGEIRDMYELLAAWYGDPRLTAAEQELLSQVLDQATRTVVYSREHWLEEPHYVQPHETLDMVAQRYEVPWQLLAKINGVSDPNALEPGQALKVIRGPFSAVIDLSSRQLVLQLEQNRYGARYAGRFNIGTGLGMLNETRTDFRGDLYGSYQVRAKERDPVFRSPVDQTELPSDHPDNHYAGYRIELSEELVLHGTNHPSDIGPDAVPHAVPGYVCMRPSDMDDIIDILSVGSLVKIQP